MNAKKTVLSSALALAMGGTALSANAALTTSASLVFDSGVGSCLLGGTYPDNCVYGLKTVASGSWFGMDNDGNSSIAPSEKTPITALDGIHIGTTSLATGSHSGPINGSESPAFDIWEFFGGTGMDYMTVAPTVTNGDVLGDGGTVKYLDWSGWTVTWNGIAAIPMGAGAWNGNPEGQAVITCSTASCSDSSTFTLEYSGTVPAGDPSGFGGVQYALYLEGHVVGAASPVPVPAAAWLFGSGLVGLVGVARRRRKA